MVLDQNFIVDRDINEFIMVPYDGLIEIKINYAVPGRKGYAKTTLLFRVKALVEMFNTNTEINSHEFGIKINDKMKMVFFKAKVLAHILFNYYVRHMKAVQSQLVNYRKLTVPVFNSLEWHNGTTINSGEQPLSQMKIYNFKTGPICGDVNGPSFNNSSLALLLYGAGLNDVIDKPSRFLVAGVTFKDYGSIIRSDSAAQLFNNLYNPIVLNYSTSAKKLVSFTPVVKVGSEIREIQIVQVEGLSFVAGAKR